jgi:hypothetical protein
MRRRLDNAVMTKGVALLAGRDERFRGFVKRSLKRYLDTGGEASRQHGAWLFSRCEEMGLPEICIVREAPPLQRFTVLLASEY